MGRCCRSLRGWVGAMACLFCIGLLVSVATESGGAKAVAAPLATAMENLKDLRSGTSRDMDPLSASKRRVPNGADPIHNRRAGKSGRNPGRA